MRRNDITEEGLRDWIREQEFTYASSSRERKSLICRFDGIMEIRVGGEVLLHTSNIGAAVFCYNGITETYIDPLKNFKV